MKFFLLLLLISVLDVMAVILARYYIENSKKWTLWSSLFFFASSAYVFVQLMAFRSTAIINILAAAASTIFVTLFYFVIFKERITLGQWAGIAISLMGILMLEI